MFAMHPICLISFGILMIQMVFYKHEDIDVMCKILCVKLDKLSTWFALSKLALDISNTNFMIISNRKSIQNNISINGVNLQKVDSLRCLGVHADHQII